MLSGAAPRRPILELAAAPDASHRAAIFTALVAYNDRHVVSDPTAGPFAAVIRDGESGPVIGGAWGQSYYRWLFIELLAVPEAQRGQGFGRRILHMADAEARRRGCVGIWLDTFSFQARGFYEKHGFSVFGRIDDYPEPHHRVFLAKRLTAD